MGRDVRMDWEAMVEQWTTLRLGYWRELAFLRSDCMELGMRLAHSSYATHSGY